MKDMKKTKAELVSEIQELKNALKKPPNGKTTKLFKFRGQIKGDDNYEYLVEIITDGVTIIQDEKITYVNETLCNMAGRSAEEYLDHPFLDFIHPDTRPVLMEYYGRYDGGESDMGLVDAALIHKNGKRIEVQINATRLKVNDQPALLVVLHDTTSKKQAEIALRQTRELYKTVVNATSESILLVDADGQLLFCNAESVERFHLDETCLESMNLVDISGGKSADVVKEALSCVCDHKGPTRFEFFKDDRFFEVVLTTVQKTGSVREVVCAIRDFTDRKRAEQSMKLRLDLVQLITKISNRFIRIHSENMDVEILKAMEEIGEFTGVDRCFVHLFDPETAGRKSTFQYNRETLKPLGPDFFDTVLTGNKIWLEKLRRDQSIHHTKGNPAPPIDCDVVAQYGVQSILLVPMNFKGQAEGVVGFLSVSAKRSWTPEESALLFNCGTIFVNALIRRRDENILHMHNRKLEIVNQIISEANSCTDTETLFEKVTSKVIELMDFDAGGIYLREENSEFATIRHHKNLTETFLKSVEKISIHEAFYQELYGKKQAAFLEFLDRQFPERIADSNIKSVGAIPIMVQDEVVGNLNVASQRRHKFTQTDRATLIAIGKELGNGYWRLLSRKKLQVSEETAHALLNAPTDMMVLLDTEGIILAVNNEMASAFNQTAETLVGHKLTDLFMKDILQDRITAFRKMMESGQPQSYEEEFMGRWHEANIYPVKDENQKVTRVAIFARDVTLAKKAEINLKESLKIAVEADMAKSRFLSNISHEIRTPLSSIIGLATLMLKDPKMTWEKNRGYARIIKESGRSLLEMIDRVLSYSKTQSGQLAAKPRKFNFPGLITSVEARFSHQCAAKCVALDCNIDENIPEELVGDTIFLEQVLNNLVGNALKFTKQGKIALTVIQKEKTSKSVALEFCVSDTGIGIDKIHFDRIFSSFFQVDGSTTREYPGSGLGLSISKELVTLMGGNIRVESRLGKGSDFYFSCEMGVSEEV